MAQGERIRVVVGDPAPLNRALARHFLEEDGFEVVGDASRGADLLELVQRTNPDAVVLDEEIAGAGALDVVAPLKKASPGTKIVMLTGQPERSGSRGVDATLEKGVGLSNLSPVLRRLCGIGVVAGRGQAPPARLRQGASLEALRATVVTERSDRRLMVRIAAVAATLAVLSALALALISEPGRIGPAPGSPSPQASPGPVTILTGDEGLGYLADAMVSLEGVVEALRNGNVGEAAQLARSLMASRAAAIAAGADVSPLNDLISRDLLPLLQSADLRTILMFEGILGPLLPPIEIAPPEQQPTGGTIVLATGPTGSGGGGGGHEGGGGGGGDGGGISGGGTGDGGGGATGDGDGAPSGHGNHYGWSHKPPKGGWHYGRGHGPGNPKLHH